MKRHQVLRYLFAIMLAGTAAAALYVSPAASGQSKSTQSEELQKVLRDYDLLELDTAATAKQARETGRLSLATSERTFDLNLTLHDMRAPGYRAVAYGEGGIERELPAGPVNTFKGTVNGAKSSEVRLTIDEGKFEGLIIVDGQTYFVEPAARYSPSTAAAASSADGGDSFVLYSEADVIKGSIGECGVTLAEQVAAATERVGASPTVAAATAKGGSDQEVFAPFHEVEIATEADFEYFQFFGSNADTAKGEIESIINQVSGIYRSQIGITFRITEQSVWEVSNDPYNATEAGAALTEFRNFWNANRANIPRDVAHMWTGKDFTGSTIGIASQPGVDCEDGRLAYGMSQRLSNANDKVLVAAHEIGHNFNASHTNQPTQIPGCENTIMHASLGGATQQNFCQFSRDQITNHTFENASCLTRLTQPGCSYALSTSVVSFGGGGGSTTVSVAAGGGCNWGVAEAASWITVTSGETGSGTGGFTLSVTPNAGGPRSARVDVAGQVLVVTQAASSNCVVTPLSGNQSLSGRLSAADCRSGMTGREEAFVDLYSFSGVAGEQVVIEMSAASTPPLDTYLYLFGPGNFLVAENDDIVLGQNTNSRLPVGGVFTLPATGTYFIAATSFERNETGNYVLTLSGQPTPSNSVAFSSAAYAATESASSSVVVTVTRGGDVAGAANVNYATSDGSASEVSDYNTTTGTLRFAPNETTKTFTVFVTDDVIQEGAESVNIALSNPVGTTLGSPAAAVLTANSNDAASGFSPVRAQNFDPQFFVRQHYRDFLNRDPDAAGLAFWAGQTTGCGNPDPLVCRINVSAAFFLSIEFQETGFLVYRTHQAAFNTKENLAFRDFMRDTQDVGRGVVIGQAGADALLETNKVVFFNDFVNRPAFLARYPLSLTAAQFVDGLNANTGGALTQAQRDDLVSRLNLGQLSRSQVLRALAEHPTFTNSEKSRAFVLMQYFGYMRRQQDAAGFNFWLGKLNEFNGDYINSEMVKSFIISGEYLARFGTP